MSQINLKPFGPIPQMDWCQVIFAFLFRGLFFGIFAAFMRKQLTL